MCLSAIFQYFHGIKRVPHRTCQERKKSYHDPLELWCVCSVGGKSAPQVHAVSRQGGFTVVCTSHWNGCNCQGGLFRSDQHRHWGYTVSVSWPLILPVAQSTWLLHTPCFWCWSPNVQGLLMWLKDGVRACGWWISIPWRPCQHHAWISRGFLSSLSQQPFPTVEQQDPSMVTDIRICLCKPRFTCYGAHLDIKGYQIPQKTSLVQLLISELSGSFLKRQRIYRYQVVRFWEGKEKHNS